jgi:undecaprenyl-diphosphatase
MGGERMIEYMLNIDRMVMQFINTFARQSYILDRMIHNLNSIDLLKGAVFVAVLWWIWFSKNCPPSLGAGGNRMFVARSIVGGLIAIGLGRCLQQAMPERLRPMHDPRLGFQLPYGARPETLEGWSSLPSDHAVLFFALATAIWLWSRAWGAIAFLWAFMICMPRIYMGYHYPSDIIVGALLGVASMLAIQSVPVPPVRSRRSGAMKPDIRPRSTRWRLLSVIKSRRCSTTCVNSAQARSSCWAWANRALCCAHQLASPPDTWSVRVTASRKAEQFLDSGAPTCAAAWPTCGARNAAA